MKEKIGRKVYEFVENGYDCKLNTEKVYTIVGHTDLQYTIRDEEGNEKTLYYWNVLVLPKWELNEEQRIDDYLKNNGLYPEVWKSGSEIIVSIDWGDWKHDHIWCRTAMGYIGYKEVGGQVTEENGSDCYSAEHYFQFFKDTAIVAR